MTHTEPEKIVLWWGLQKRRECYCRLSAKGSSCRVTITLNGWSPEVEVKPEDKDIFEEAPGADSFAYCRKNGIKW